MSFHSAFQRRDSSALTPSMIPTYSFLLVFCGPLYEQVAMRLLVRLPESLGVSNFFSHKLQAAMPILYMVSRPLCASRRGQDCEMVCGRAWPLELQAQLDPGAHPVSLGACLMPSLSSAFSYAGGFLLCNGP